MALVTVQRELSRKTRPNPSISSDGPVTADSNNSYSVTKHLVRFIYSFGGNGIF